MDKQVRWTWKLCFVVLLIAFVLRRWIPIAFLNGFVLTLSLLFLSYIVVDILLNPKEENKMVETISIILFFVFLPLPPLQQYLPWSRLMLSVLSIDAAIVYFVIFLKKISSKRKQKEDKKKKENKTLGGENED